MHQSARDLAKAGGYILSVGLLLGSVAFAGTAALRELSHSSIFNWAADLIEPRATQETRLSQTLISSREIKAALARQIPRPEPLPPITAKLAYGHLRPGGSGLSAQHLEKLNLPKATLDSHAMHRPDQFRSSNTVIPDLHKAY